MVFATSKVSFKVTDPFAVNVPATVKVPPASKLPVMVALSFTTKVVLIPTCWFDACNDPAPISKVDAIRDEVTTELVSISVDDAPTFKTPDSETENTTWPFESTPWIIWPLPKLTICSAVSDISFLFVNTFAAF